MSWHFWYLRLIFSAKPQHPRAPQPARQVPRARPKPPAASERRAPRTLAARDDVMSTVKGAPGVELANVLADGTKRSRQAPVRAGFHHGDLSDEYEDEAAPAAKKPAASAAPAAAAAAAAAAPDPRDQPALHVGGKATSAGTPSGDDRDMAGQPATAVRPNREVKEIEADIKTLRAQLTSSQERVRESTQRVADSTSSCCPCPPVARSRTLTSARCCQTSARSASCSATARAR